MTTNDTPEELDDEEEAWQAYDIDAFIAGYEECADSDSDEEMLGGESLGWHPDTMKQFDKDCHAFAMDNIVDLVASGLDPRRAGCDFWLTRNRHGAGFWDEGYMQSDEANAALARLTEASHAYGDAGLYVGDDGWIYQQ